MTHNLSKAQMAVLRETITAKKNNVRDNSRDSFSCEYKVKFAAAVLDALAGYQNEDDGDVVVGAPGGNIAMVVSAVAFVATVYNPSNKRPQVGRIVIAPREKVEFPREELKAEMELLCQLVKPVKLPVK